MNVYRQPIPEHVHRCHVCGAWVYDGKSCPTCLSQCECHPTKEMSSR
jgi:hypothetical protein